VLDTAFASWLVLPVNKFSGDVAFAGEHTLFTSAAFCWFERGCEAGAARQEALR